MAMAAMRALCLFVCLVARESATEQTNQIQTLREFHEAHKEHEWTMKEKGNCILDVSSASGFLLQAGLKMWSATEFCKRAANPNMQQEFNGVELTPQQNRNMCINDVGATLQLLTNVAVSIITILEGCGNRHAKQDQCMKSAFNLAGSVSELSGTVSSMYNGCSGLASTTDSPFEASDAGHVQFNLKVSTCAVDVQTATQGLMGVIATLLTIKDSCNGHKDNWENKCAVAVLDITSALAQVAQFVIQAVSDCKIMTQDTNTPLGSEPCGSEVASTVASLATISSSSITMKDHCKTPAVGENARKLGKAKLSPLTDALSPEQASQVASLKARLLADLEGFGQDTRLFGVDHRPLVSSMQERQEATLPIQPILIGMIPLTAVIAFFMGRRAATWRQVRGDFNAVCEE